MASDANKQASAVSARDDVAIDTWIRDVAQFYRAAEDLYQRGLTCGVPKELARIVMPVGHYSRMRASANLRNWLAFLTLRMDPAAQWEIRQYAQAVGQVIAAYFPQTYKLFSEEQT